MINLVYLGYGAKIIAHGRYEGLAAIFIEPAPKPGEVGADASDSGLKRDEVVDNSTVISFANVECARTLRDELDATIRAMASPPTPAETPRED